MSLPRPPWQILVSFVMLISILRSNFIDLRIYVKFHEEISIPPISNLIKYGGPWHIIKKPYFIYTKFKIWRPNMAVNFGGLSHLRQCDTFVTSLHLSINFWQIEKIIKISFPSLFDTKNEKRSLIRLSFSAIK